MTVTTTLSDNPYCKVRNEVININYGNRNYQVPVEKVSKMYLSRKKRSYLSFIPGVKFFTFDSTYNLFIKTRDFGQILFENARRPRRAAFQVRL